MTAPVEALPRSRPWKDHRYADPAASQATADDVLSISDRLGLCISRDDAPEYAWLVTEQSRAYEAVADVDVLVMPTTPTTARPLIERGGATISEEVAAAVPLLRNTCPFDVTHHPGLSIPAGEVDRLPAGMMFVGKHFDEAMLYGSPPPTRRRGRACTVDGRCDASAWTQRSSARTARWEERSIHGTQARAPTPRAMPAAPTVLWVAEGERSPAVQAMPAARQMMAARPQQAAMAPAADAAARWAAYHASSEAIDQLVRTPAQCCRGSASASERRHTQATAAAAAPRTSAIGRARTTAEVVVGVMDSFLPG